MKPEFDTTMVAKERADEAKPLWDTRGWLLQSVIAQRWGLTQRSVRAHFIKAGIEGRKHPFDARYTLYRKTDVARLERQRDDLKGLR